MACCRRRRNRLWSRQLSGFELSQGVLYPSFPQPDRVGQTNAGVVQRWQTLVVAQLGDSGPPRRDGGLVRLGKRLRGQHHLAARRDKQLAMRRKAASRACHVAAASRSRSSAMRASARRRRRSSDRDRASAASAAASSSNSRANSAWRAASAPASRASSCDAAISAAIFSGMSARAIARSAVCTRVFKISPDFGWNGGWVRSKASRPAKIDRLFLASLACHIGERVSERCDPGRLVAVHGQNAFDRLPARVARRRQRWQWAAIAAAMARPVRCSA